MKPGELTIDVTARIGVDDYTGERCLRLLEWYVNDRKNVVVMGEKDNDGLYHFWFAKEGDRR